jgi:Cu/Ag efflux pump CusA
MGAEDMTGWLVRWSLKFRLIILAAAVGILGFGITTLPTMPVDNLPEFSPPHVEIQTEALGLSAVEVEQLITSPMEADLLNGVAWLDEIRSKSVPGLSSIEMVFEPGTDIFRARQLVAERLTQAFALPNVSQPPVLMQPLSSTSRVMMVQLTSEDVSPIDMSVLARWNIKPALMGVPGVANVSIFGQREQQLQVQVDPAKLKANNVTLNQVIETAGNAVWVSPLSFLEASTPGTGGFLESANQRIGIQHVLPIRTPEDLGKVSIEGSQNKALKLSDVTTLSEDHQPLIGEAVTGKSPGLLLVI